MTIFCSCQFHPLRLPQVLVKLRKTAQQMTCAYPGWLACWLKSVPRFFHGTGNLLTPPNPTHPHHPTYHHTAGSVTVTHKGDDYIWSGWLFSAGKVTASPPCGLAFHLIWRGSRPPHNHSPQISPPLSLSQDLKRVQPSSQVPSSQWKWVGKPDSNHPSCQSQFSAQISRVGKND